jgi:hypothetical protein
MNLKAWRSALALILFIVCPARSEDVERTEPFTAAERETAYTAAIEKRAGDILKLLAIGDDTKAARIHDAIVAQYRSLRARDEAIENMFQALSKNSPGIETNRNAILRSLSTQLHDHFLSRLAKDLSPEQMEMVKDKMTYNKVKVTYDAYCEILPNLSADEKARILGILKAGREEAMDGGSADEKTAIFQKHKNQINAFLMGNGHDVGKATREWEARQTKPAESAAH